MTSIGNFAAALAALLLPVIAVTADQEEVLFKFDQRTQFYHFSNKESTVKLTASAVNGLEVNYRFGGGSPYVGIGIGFGYLPGRYSDWSRFGADGNLVLTVKADAPGQVEISIAAEGKSYRNSFPVTPEWTRVTLPFRSFYAGTTGYDPMKNPPKKLELRPPRRTAESRFYLREVTLSDRKVELPSEQKKELTGQVVDPTGKAVADAIVTLQNDRKDRYGWNNVVAVKTEADGRFKIPFTPVAEISCHTEPLVPPPVKPAESLNSSSVFFIEWEFVAPFEFDEIRLVNAGAAKGERRENTRSGRILIKTAADPAWQPLSDFRDNSADTITIACGKNVIATAFRLEITAGAQVGAQDCARIQEIEFYRHGRLMPLSGFDYEKHFQLFRNLKANNAAEDRTRPDFAVDANRETCWRTLSRATIAVPVWRQSWQVEIAALGRKTSVIAINPDAAVPLKTTRIVLPPLRNETATITVDPAQTLRSINPLIYGVNMGLWHNSDFDNPRIADATREAGVTIIRYPGGGRSQSARWQREEASWNTMPAAGRPGDNCVMTPKQLDRFIAFCRRVGAEPMLTINQRTDDTANLADMVKYLNIEKKYGVKFFEIGNEPEGYIKEWGFGNNWVHNRDAFTLTYRKAADIHRRYDAALKAVDPTILLMGPVTANADFFDLAIPPFWEIVGTKLDVLAVHRYPQCDLKPGSANLSDAALLDRPREWEKLSAQLSSMNQRYSPSRRPLYAVTEWHTAYHSPGPRQQQIVGGLYVAENLCEMIKNGIDIGNIWVLTGCGEYNLFNSGKFLVRPGEIMKVPSYYFFKELARNFKGRLIACRADRPQLRTYAAIEDNRMTVVCINISPDIAFQTRCTPPAGWKTEAMTVVDRFTPGTKQKFSGNELTVPAYSMVILHLIR